MLVHKGCLGEVEPVPEHGLHCLKCDCMVGDSEVEDMKIHRASKVSR